LYPFENDKIQWKVEPQSFQEEDLELESIQEVYMPMNHEQNNHPQDGATGIKRNSLALTPPPTKEKTRNLQAYTAKPKLS